MSGHCWRPSHLWFKGIHCPPSQRHSFGPHPVVGAGNHSDFDLVVLFLKIARKQKVKGNGVEEMEETATGEIKKNDEFCDASSVKSTTAISKSIIMMWWYL